VNVIGLTSFESTSYACGTRNKSHHGETSHRLEGMQNRSLKWSLQSMIVQISIPKIRDSGWELMPANK
jgi:hypothetical protein